MATKKNVKVEFVSDFSNSKKGDIREFSRDISKSLINDLKVAKLYVEKEVKKTPKK